MDVTCPEDALFNLLIKALEKNKDVHLNIVWGTMAFLATAIGWLLTSEKAREFISIHDLIRKIGIISLLLIASVHYYMLYGTYNQSSALVEAIKGDAYFINVLKSKELAYSFFQLSLKQVLFRSTFTLILFSLLIYSLHWMKNINHGAIKEKI